MTEFAPRLPALSERLLLFELNHRINNEFASAINCVSLAAVRTESAEVKIALNHVVDLLHQHADVHRALKTPERNVVIDAAEYLQVLCRAMCRSRLDRLGIKLVLAADTVWLHSERCWRLGMIVNELVTNVARHAFFENRDGEVRVELSQAGTLARCGVSDNGSAAARVRPGHGLEIIGDLAKSLSGQINHSFGARGSVSTLALPFIGRELQANRRRRPRYRIGSEYTESQHHAQQ